MMQIVVGTIGAGMDLYSTYLTWQLLHLYGKKCIVNKPQYIGEYKLLTEEVLKVDITTPKKKEK